MKITGGRQEARPRFAFWAAPEAHMKNAFFKGHGLGNDYIAVDPAELDFKVDSWKYPKDLRPQLGRGVRRNSRAKRQ